MAIDIGPRVGLDGEAEFRKQLNNINTALKTLGTEMQKVTSEFSENANSEQALIAKNKVLQNSIDAQKKKIGEVANALDQAKKKYGENSNEALKWQQVMNRSQTSLNKLESELRQNDKSLDEMHRGLRDAETGLENFDDAADDAKDSADGFGSGLRDAFIGGGIVAVIQGLASSIAGLVEGMTEYNRIQASLEVSSQRAGYSVQETANQFKTLYGVLGDDQTAATTTANLQALGLSQEQLQQATNATIGAWATYGDSIPIDGLAEAINETAKVGTVTGTFADVLNWAGTSEDDFNEKLASCSDESERTNLILQEMANQGLVQAGEAWQQNNKDIVANNQAQAELNATLSEFSEMLSPAVAMAKNGFNEILRTVLSLVDAFKAGGISGFAEQIASIFTNIGDSIYGSGGMVSTGAKILEQIVTGIVDSAPIVLNALVGIFENIGAQLPSMISTALDSLQTIGDKLSELAPVLIQKGFEMLQALVTGIVDSIPALIEKVPQIVSTFANIINDNFPTILAKGAELLGQLALGLIQAIPTLIANIPQIISAIIDTLMAFQWVNLGQNIIKFLGDGIGAMKSFVTQKGTDILNGIKGAIQNLPGNLLNIGKSAIADLGGAIRSGLSTIKGAASNIVSGVIDTFTSLPGKVLSIGKNIVQGLWNGMSDMTGWIIDKIQGFGSSVLDGIKDFFGINSPSKLMEDQVGKFMAQGIGVGFVDEMKSVNRQIQKSMQSTLAGSEKIVATAQNSFQMQIDYDRLAKMISPGDIYLDWRQVGRTIPKGVVL